MKKPEAKHIYATPGVLDKWEIKFPSTAKVPGAEYVATTYPNSELVYVQTKTGRPVSATVGRNLIPAIKEAIKVASAAKSP